MYQKTSGIVLHTIKYNDSSNIVDIYTERNGRMSFLAPIPRSKKAAVKTVLFQPLSMVAVEMEVRPNSGLHRIRELKALFPFHSIPYNPYKSAIALFITEFLYRALREEAENAPLYAYLVNSIQWLDGCERDFANFHLVFLMRLSRFLGLFPNMEGYRRGDYFDLLNAEFTSRQPLHHSFLRSEEAYQLLQLIRMNYETMHLFEMNRSERNHCLMIINEYYQLHLPDFPVLKSISVLQELFA